MVLNLRRMLRAQRERKQAEEYLAGLLDHEQGTPLEAFPPSSELTPQLRALGDGIYLWLFRPGTYPGPRRTEGSVFSVIWAESDYWVKRCWDPPPAGHESLAELGAPPDREHALPSLKFVGRPSRLTFSALFKYECAQPNGNTNPIHQSMTRTWECVYCGLIGAGSDVHYYFEAFSPAPDDLPVAIMFILRERAAVRRRREMTG